MKPTRRLHKTLALAGTAACVTGAGMADATGAGAAQAHASAAVPAAVAPLLAKMQALQITSERLTADVTIHARRVPARLKALRELTVHLSGEAALSPQQAAFQVSALGHQEEVRLIGTTAYLDDPAIAALDGNRPWVQRTVPADESPVGSDPGVGQLGSTAPFAGTAALISGASRVRDLGASSVDGQAVTRVEIAFNPARLLARELSPRLRRQLRLMHVHPKAKMELAINGEGLPVQTAGVIALGPKIKVDVDAEVTAVDIPVSVTAPAASETITAAQLAAIVKQHHK